MSSINETEIILALPEIEALTQRLRYVTSISCCIITLILLEILSTLNEEIAYIWRRPWSLFKILFIQCRYLSIIPAIVLIVPPAPSNSYCSFQDWYMGLVNTFLTLSAGSALLAIRLDRLYASKRMRRILIALVFVENALQLAASVSVLPKFTLMYTPNPLGIPAGVSGYCNVLNVSRSLWLSKSFIMLPYLILVCIYIGIAWHAFTRHRREKASLSNIWAVRKNFAPLYILFFRDGVICYIINFFGILCGFLLLTVPSGINYLALVGPVVITGITSISCCRLALLLHGDPGHATGVYQMDINEVCVEVVVTEDPEPTDLQFLEEAEGCFGLSATAKHNRLNDEDVGLGPVVHL